jgi:CMP-N,N'-diacetyllegionaminic acid synthase
VGRRTRRIAIIPARGGSKGIPRKNLAELNGQTLVERAVKVALETTLFDLIFVSTDDDEIADVSRRAGADVSFLRPSRLALDTTPSIEVVSEVLSAWRARRNDFETLTLLEPTSPLRTPELVHDAVVRGEQPPFDGCLTLSPVDLHFHPLKQIEISDEGVAYAATPGSDLSKPPRRQDLRPTFVRNGIAYVCRVKSLESGSGLAGFRPLALVTPGPFVNIDTAEDLDFVRDLLKQDPPR